MTIALMGAMEEEVCWLKDDLQQAKKVTKAGIEFVEGKLGDEKVVVVHGGIGKVNAAVCSQILIDDFQISKLIFTGVAGCLNQDLDIGDIVISADTVQHDVDASAFGYDLGHIPRLAEKFFSADKELIKLALQASEGLKFAGHPLKAITGRILSGDQFIASAEKCRWLRETFAGDCAEMEGAAVAQVCSLNQIPFVIIRAMSDKADGSAHMNYEEFVKLAAENSYKIVKKMITG